MARSLGRRVGNLVLLRMVGLMYTALLSAAVMVVAFVLANLCKQETPKNLSERDLNAWLTGYHQSARGWAVGALGNVCIFAMVVCVVRMALLVTGIW